MIIVVTSGAAFSLEQPDDCGAFHLEARGIDARDLASALDSVGGGRLAGDDAFVDRAIVEQLAEGQVGDDWAERFAGMIAYAEKKGWLDDDGLIQAHIEWR